ncbi:hypothetical protein LB507_000233 [Fusarium sp. FIESC RH6]|nr:hypothetical protein LB507_000233 [Fusarium sp. FIESC RH6]
MLLPLSSRRNPAIPLKWTRSKLSPFAQYGSSQSSTNMLAFGGIDLG